MEGDKTEEAGILCNVTSAVVRMTRAASSRDFGGVVAAVIACEKEGGGRDRDGALDPALLAKTVVTRLWNTLPSM